MKGILRACVIYRGAESVTHSNKNRFSLCLNTAVVYFRRTLEDDICAQAVTGLNEDILDRRPAAAPLRSKSRLFIARLLKILNFQG